MIHCTDDNQRVSFSDFRDKIDLWSTHYRSNWLLLVGHQHRVDRGLNLVYLTIIVWNQKTILRNVIDRNSSRRINSRSSEWTGCAWSWHRTSSTRSRMRFTESCLPWILCSFASRIFCWLIRNLILLTVEQNQVRSTHAHDDSDWITWSHLFFA